MHDDVLDEAEPTADMRRIAERVGAEDPGEGEGEGDGDDEDADFLLEEDSGAPNLVPEEHPRGILAGRIEMLDKIGEGGMGSVWRGHHLKLDRAVAVKVLDATLQLRADGRERFIREGKALALLEHPNVVGVYDCDQLPDGKLFLCMELLDGETLRALIKRGVRPDPLEVIDIGLQVCSAIEAAHQHGILHRDLTPSNIMRLRDAAKTIKVIDWGLCKYLDLFYMRAPQKYGAPPGSRLVTPSGCRFGTPDYMAPEMIRRGDPGSPSFCTDVYALGVVLYEVLTGRHPFGPGDRKQLRPIDMFLPGFDYDDLETALRDALRYEPEKRTPNMVEMRESLDMARECLLAQRAAPTPLHPDQTALAPAAVPGEMSVARDEPTVSKPGTELAEATTHSREDPRTPTERMQPGGRLAVVLALLIGVGVGAGGLLGAQRLGGAGSGTGMSEPSVVLAATPAPEVPRASATESPAGLLQTDLATGALATPGPQRGPLAGTNTSTSTAHMNSASPPSSSTPGRPDKDNQPSSRTRSSALATVTDTVHPPVRTPRPTPPPQTFQQAMAALEPTIRECARKASFAPTPTTVQVRRKAGVPDAVKVLKLTREHPFSVCVADTMRAAKLPAGTGPIEGYTFFQ